MKIPIIVEGEKYYLYIEGTSWGLIRPGELTPFEEIVAKVLTEVRKEFEEISSEYSICYPTLKEVIKGELDPPESYETSYCRKLAREILKETRRRLRLDP